MPLSLFATVCSDFVKFHVAVTRWAAGRIGLVAFLARHFDVQPGQRIARLGVVEILGGLPAVAGSAVINEIFEEDINNLTNYQYEVLGTISEPKLERVKQEIK